MKLQDLPHSDEIERAVLGGIIMDFGSRTKFLEVIRPEWFYRQSYADVFGVLKAGIEQGREMELADLSGELQRQGKLEKCGGAVAVSKLTDNPSFDADGCALILRGDYCRRELIQAAEKMRADSLQAGADATVIAGEFIKRCEQIREGITETTSAGVTEYDSMLSVAATLETRKPSVVMSGIESLDNMTGGFQAGELIVVTGETGIGKTAAVRQITQASCVRGAHGLFCSCEMLHEHLTMRKISALAGIPIRQLRNGSLLSKDQFSSVLNTTKKFCKTCRIYDESPEIAKILDAVAKMHSEGTLAWAAIDYDELVEASGKDELERQSSVAAKAKEIAMKYEIPVFLISQLRKPLDKEDRQHPTLARLYGSGAKVKHASTVIYVDREWVRELKGSETAAQIILLKHRDGQVGRLPCSFDIRTLTFRDQQEVSVP